VQQALAGEEVESLVLFKADASLSRYGPGIHAVA